jgi:hypothetical protein
MRRNRRTQNADIFYAPKAYSSANGQKETAAEESYETSAAFFAFI